MNTDAFMMGYMVKEARRSPNLNDPTKLYFLNDDSTDVTGYLDVGSDEDFYNYYADIKKRYNLDELPTNQLDPDDYLEWLGDRAAAKTIHPAYPVKKRRKNTWEAGFK